MPPRDRSKIDNSPIKSPNIAEIDPKIAVGHWLKPMKLYFKSMQYFSIVLKFILGCKSKLDIFYRSYLVTLLSSNRHRFSLSYRRPLLKLDYGGIFASVVKIDDRSLLYKYRLPGVDWTLDVSVCRF